MPRLTRIEQRAQTRADLLEAAHERFLAVGYAAAGLDEIAERAGYSKGAIYSNFNDKPTLCGEVLELIHREKFSELSELALANKSLEDRFEAVLQWAEATVGDIDWTMLELEFVILSRTDASLTKVIVELRNSIRQKVIALLMSFITSGEFNTGSSSGAEYLLENLDEETGFDLGAIADLLLSTGIGFGIQRAVDPTVSIQPMMAAVRSALLPLVISGTAKFS
ncbi:MAG: TetR/AcrR family transcriptional regulator [Mycobacteriaceae bacterium]